MSTEDTEVVGNEEVLYRSSDLYFSAFLCALELPMIGTEEEALPQNRKKVYFVFKIPKKDLRRLKMDYFGGTGKVRAKLYADRIRSLKQLCFT